MIAFAEQSTIEVVANKSYPGHPDLNLTAEEKQVYGKLLKEADPEGSYVTGDIAVKFFERTKLPPDVLGQVRTSFERVHASES